MFYNNDLFSYLLRLPVIYSSIETEMICAGFKKDKNTSGVKFKDFCSIICLGQRQIVSSPTLHDTILS